MKNTLRLLLLGLLTWIVPFVTAFFFMDKTGKVAVDIYFFKTIMIIVGAITGAFAINLYFKKIESSFLRKGVIAGFVWLAVNIVLDILVLLPVSEMTYGDYFQQIGLRYLTILITCSLVGYVLSAKQSQLAKTY